MGPFRCALRPRPLASWRVRSSLFDNAGWCFDWNTAGQSGARTLYIYAHSTVSGNWQLLTRSVTVSP